MAFKPYRMWRKFRRDPIAYCIDSKHAFLRKKGARMFEEQTRRFEAVGANHADIMITVVMTAYNTSHLVEGAVRSVLAQSHKNFELMVIDDASTDDTLDVLKKLADEDTRVRVFHSPANHGTYWSKNWCLSHARGKFVAFHDSDDLSDPMRLQTQLGAILSGNKTAVTCRWRRVDGQGKPLNIDGLSERMAAISLMIRREEVLEKTGFFDSVRISADTEFITRLTQVFGMKQIHHMRQVLYTGLLRDGSLTTGENSGFSWKTDNGVSFIRELSGDRADYHKHFHEWHDSNIGNEAVLTVEFPQSVRKFPAPDGIRRNCDDMNTDQVIEVSHS
ncbi:glycosyltransferase family 2 protein [Kordiimonas laminariae]|uniref:glycosyltransferase family 2 protein n=1 Tax=Kordiimonas laminariae TaxID=2917717 RepID=UPI001FF6A03C|nr:glycosyltransferase family 2 protein [Kordiimonas laminariae]MCK0067989.1 glycosyltransferase [Kordiimonas laminariae]